MLLATTLSLLCIVLNPMMTAARSGGGTGLPLTTIFGLFFYLIWCILSPGLFVRVEWVISVMIPLLSASFLCLILTVRGTAMISAR
jgi:hypothetical protein